MEKGARATSEGSFLVSTPASLGFGAWAIGGTDWGPGADEADRRRTIARAFDLGIDFFDTAPTYGDSESLLGAELASKRSRVRFATKVGPRDDPRASLENSLRKLQCDYVDLVQLHEVGPDFERSLETLAGLVAEGKAKSMGLCNATARQVSRAIEIAPITTFQAPYNLFDREIEQRELPLCSEQGLDFLAYRPLASGMLTSGFTAATPKNFEQADHRQMIWWFKGEELKRRLTILERLREIAFDHKQSVSSLALGWALSRPGVTYVLAGARTTAQVEDNITAVQVPLEVDSLNAIDKIVRVVYRPARATPEALSAAKQWGEREMFIVERMDGQTPYDTIAAEWAESHESPLMGAQVRQFADQLAAANMAGYPQ